MKTINFKIILNENPQVYQHGFVEVPEDVEESAEWTYLKGNGVESFGFFVCHDGIEITGITHEQENEVERFRELVQFQECDYIDEVILTADEDENETYIHNGITVIVGEGAEFEVEICKYNPLDFYNDCSTAFEIGRQYFMTFKPKYNGESVVNLIKQYLDYGILENPYTFDTITANSPKMNEEKADFNKDSIAMEVPKICFDWEDDYEGDMVDDILSEFKDALESAYRKALVHHIGVAGIASNIYEEKLKSENSIKVFDESGIQDFGDAWEDTFLEEDLWTLYNLAEEDVEKAVKDEFAEKEEYYRDY